MDRDPKKVFASILEAFEGVSKFPRQVAEYYREEQR